MFNLWIFVAIASCLAFINLLWPEVSYEFKLSLIIAVLVIIYFSVFTVINLNLFTFIYCLALCFFVYKGGNDVPIKTATGVFSTVNNNYLGRMDTGSFTLKNWADPIFNKVTANVDGIPNTTIDLQPLKVEVMETPEMQTKTRGIQCVVKNIVLMLKFEGDMKLLFDIEGSVQTIKERCTSFVLEFFLDKIGEMNPVDLDTDKGNTLRNLGNQLRTELNQFCKDNKYPYKIGKNSTVTIGDTELDKEYYKVLGAKKYAELEQDAEDVKANRLTTRLRSKGLELLPNGTEAEQFAAAKVALGITKETIEKKTFGLDGDTGKLAKEIAKEFFKN